MVNFIPLTPLVPMGADLAETMDQSDEIANRELNKLASKPKEDITFLESAISWVAVGFSAFTLVAFGKKLPMYENSSAGQWVKKRIPEVKAWLNNHPRIATGVKFFHEATKTVVNLAIVLANIGLLAVNGSSLPLIPGKFSTSIKGIGDKLKAGWKALEEAPYIGKIAKGLTYLNEQKNLVVNSKTTRNVVSVVLGALLIGTGPIGIGILTAGVVADVARGAYDVNKTKVLMDELAYLRLIRDAQKKLGIAAKNDAPNIAIRKELSSALKNSVGPTIIGQGSLVAGAIMNPVGAVALIGEVAGVGVAILGNKFTEESARYRMEKEIAELRASTGVNYNYANSRKYDLAQEALTLAAKAELSEAERNSQTLLEQKKQELKEYEKYSSKHLLFTNDQLTEPKGKLAYIGRALKSCFFNIGNYLHPLKEPTSCVTFVVADIEERKKAANLTPSKKIPLASVQLHPSNTLNVKNKYKTISAAP